MAGKKKRKTEEEITEDLRKKFEAVAAAEKEYEHETGIPPSSASEFTVPRRIHNDLLEHPLTRVTESEFEHRDTHAIERERALVRFQLQQLRDLIVTLEATLIRERATLIELHAQDKGLANVLERRR